MKDRFHVLNRLMSEAYNRKDFKKTQALAEENLYLASQFKSDWNYGNAIHMANIYLGLIALENNENPKRQRLFNKSWTVTGIPST